MRERKHQQRDLDPLSAVKRGPAEVAKQERGYGEPTGREDRGRPVHNVMSCSI